MLLLPGGCQCPTPVTHGLPGTSLSSRDSPSGQRRNNRRARINRMLSDCRVLMVVGARILPRQFGPSTLSTNRRLNPRRCGSVHSVVEAHWCATPPPTDAYICGPFPQGIAESCFGRGAFNNHLHKSGHLGVSSYLLLALTPYLSFCVALTKRVIRLLIRYAQPFPMGIGITTTAAGRGSDHCHPLSPGFG